MCQALLVLQCLLIAVPIGLINDVDSSTDIDTIMICVYSFVNDDCLKTVVRQNNCIRILLILLYHIHIFSDFCVDHRPACVVCSDLFNTNYAPVNCENLIAFCSIMQFKL